MGSPKQLLRIDGITLVRRAAETALASRCQGVCVVVGAAAEAVRRELSGLRLQVVENGDWESGLAGSVRVGIGAVREAAP
jgi:molybdenum cofactor cytidylyltransferase